MAIRPKPEGYQSVIPYVIADDAEGLLRFLKAAFGAKEKGLNRDLACPMFYTSETESLHHGSYRRSRVR